MILNNKSAFLILLLTPVLSFSQQKNDLRKMELNGKVQKMRTYVCNIDTSHAFDEKTATYYIDKHYVFNEDGNIIENYTYNQQSNTVETKEVIEYDSLKRKVKSTHKNLAVLNESPSVIEYRYNPAGLMSESFSESRFSSMKTNYFYDSLGNMVKMQSSNSYHTAEIFWKYNSDNQEIEEFMPENYTVSTKYDSLKRITSKTVEYLAEKTKDQVFYHYNEAGEETENRIIMSSESGSIEYLIKITYIKDAEGNWTQMTKTIDNKIVELVKRSIEYSKK